MYWYFGNQLIDDEMDDPGGVFKPSGEPLVIHRRRSTSKGLHVTSNTLTLGPFTRSHLKKLVTCEVTNNNLTEPISVGAMIDMNCKFECYFSLINPK